MEYTEVIYDVVTGETTIRPFTEAEIKAAKAIQKEDEKRIAILEAEEAAKAQQRQVILDRLGLTADEAALLLS